MGMAYIGGNLSSSFSERVNSCGKYLMGSDRTLLQDKELSAEVFCRMNKEFIFYMEENYPLAVKAFFAKWHTQPASNKPA